MHETYNYTLRTHGLEEQGPDRTKALIGIPLSVIFSELLGLPKTDPAVIQCLETYKERYLKVCCDDSSLYEGVRELIPELAGKYDIALATTKRTQVAELTLEYFGLLKYFKTVRGIDSVSEPKPSPEIINKILVENGFQKVEAMMVGDSIYDIDAGKSAGVFTVFVTYGYGEPDKIIKKEPDFIMESFNEFSELI
jgi:HAD superfamily hydrolase (TIGR01549 family)